MKYTKVSMFSLILKHNNLLQYLFKLNFLNGSSKFRGGGRMEGKNIGHHTIQEDRIAQCNNTITEDKHQEVENK